ncbi:MAG: putative protein N(5)-glutamine methyltransferase [Actinobacteria bacterium]|nr:putative protein N(5)-glutamine methyltransferase [Actinomycetota bacterium]
MVTPATAGEIARVAARLRAAGCVFAEDEAQLLVGTARSRTELGAMVDRRASGFPLEHVLGWAEFCGLRIAVSEGVFVPRRRSEFLVRQAVKAAGASRASNHGPNARTVVVDLCCGSGAIGVAVTHLLGDAALHAADIDPAAVSCARQNVATVGGHVYQGDLYDPLPAQLRGRIDVLVVNAPYVPTGEMALMPPEARLYEPAVALDGGSDGVDVHRRVAAAAREWLAPGGGQLLIETSDRQSGRTADAMTAGGLATTVLSDDELDATVVAGVLPVRPPTLG